MDAKYPKIPLSLPAGVKLKKSVKWIVTEKVHGANFCITTTSEGPAAAASPVHTFNKRTGRIAGGDTFFNFRQDATLLPMLLPKVNTLYSSLKDRHPSLCKVQVFGELFGGAYPDLPSMHRAPVQRGVMYSPNLCFMAFDICVHLAEKPAMFLDYADVMKLCHEYDMLCAEPLMTGSYQNCMAFKLGFDSTIPKRLGLAPPPAGTNKAEGIVVRPLSGDNNQCSAERALVKFKIAEFAEAAVYDNRIDRNALSASSVSQHPLLWVLKGYINESRVQGLISKMGPLDQESDAETLSEYADALVTDAMDDYFNDYGRDEWDAAGSDAQQGIMLAFGGMCAEALDKFK
ncbi:Protein TOPLESS-RELATED PROTEIN 2 [Chytriomyces hyalinus]|nr:Protein TOPLESS-RELATED PROTEIN 2 [Chytriomyces hyalinus]